MCPFKSFFVRHQVFNHLLLSFLQSLLPGFGNVLSHVIRKCDFKIDVLQTLCLACKCAFSKVMRFNPSSKIVFT